MKKNNCSNINKWISIIVAAIIWGAASCYNKTISKEDIDKFIAKYDTTAFGELKDISVSQRSKGFDAVVYVVTKFEENYPGYFVTFDLHKDSITMIDMSHLEKSGVHGYLSRDEIFDAINMIRKHEFSYLAVDSSRNVYINPFYASEPPYFLRLKITTQDTVVRRGYVYELYRDNWYLNKTRKRQ